MKNIKQLRTLRDRILHKGWHSLTFRWGVLGWKERPVTLAEILLMIQISTQNEEKNCVNYHTNKYKELSLSIDDVSDRIGYIDINLTKGIEEQPKAIEQILKLLK